MTEAKTTEVKSGDKASQRGRRYSQAKSLIQPGKVYSLAEAVELLQKMPATKFDAAVEIHLKLGVDIKQANQQVRGSLILPHGLGKQKRVAVFCSDDKIKAAKAAGAIIAGGEDLIKQIQTTGKCDFDIAIATPEMMKLLTPIAKVLGQKGLMPNPKTETITADPDKAVVELSRGKVNFKIDNTGNIHQMIGRVSFSTEKLKDNAQAFIEAVKKARPASAKGTYLQKVVLCTSMGPAVPVQVI